jgi:predicted AAA+ superfamily ATPase
MKVITGMRRTGKSSLLLLLQNHLRKTTDAQHIIYLNFESLRFEFIQNHRDLYNYVKENIHPGKKTYLLFDEIQQVASWEKAVASFPVDFDVDIYITGSNARILSSELATLLAGRYAEIEVYPLSFGEFCVFHGLEKTPPDEAFARYLRIGGMPSLVALSESDQQMMAFLTDIYSAVLMRDVMARQHREGVTTPSDPALLDNILKYMASTIGSYSSGHKIANYLSSNGRKTSNVTVDSYLHTLAQAFILYRLPRYNIKGKALLKTNAKYYLVDMGIRNALLGTRATDRGHILENVVFLELLRRGYVLYAGRLGEQEVDFIATRTDETRYIQVTEHLTDSTIERETRSLIGIDDNYEKLIVSTDKFIGNLPGGIKHVNIIDFLFA